MTNRPKNYFTPIVPGPNSFEVKAAELKKQISQIQARLREQDQAAIQAKKLDNLAEYMKRSMNNRY